MLGRDHIQSQLDAIIAANQNHITLVFCIYVVNVMINAYLIGVATDHVLEVKMRLGDRLELYLHAGEASSRSITEPYDAILVGTKRIGHGFGLIMHPDLIEIVKREDICVKCWPAFREVLGSQLELLVDPPSQRRQGQGQRGRPPLL